MKQENRSQLPTFPLIFIIPKPPCQQTLLPPALFLNNSLVIDIRFEDIKDWIPEFFLYMIKCKFPEFGIPAMPRHNIGLPAPQDHVFSISRADIHPAIGGIRNQIYTFLILQRRYPSLLFNDPRKLILYWVSDPSSSQSFVKLFDL